MKNKFHKKSSPGSFLKTYLHGVMVVSCVLMVLCFWMLVGTGHEFIKTHQEPYLRLAMVGLDSTLGFGFAFYWARRWLLTH